MDIKVFVIPGLLDTQKKIEIGKTEKRKKEEKLRRVGCKVMKNKNG